MKSIERKVRFCYHIHSSYISSVISYKVDDMIVLGYLRG